jgi:hypothetical protein
MIARIWRMDSGTREIKGETRAYFDEFREEIDHSSEPQLI